MQEDLLELGMRKHKKDKMMLMQAQENGAVLDEELLLFLLGEQVTNFDDDMDDPSEQDLALNVDHVFELVLCVCFWHPKTMSFVKPYLSKLEAEIDHTLMELKRRAGDSATRYCSRVLVYVTHATAASQESNQTTAAGSSAVNTDDAAHPEEKDMYKADIRATNILLQGSPKDIYALINHYTDAKDIGDNVKMLLEGSKLTKDDRESQLYDDFEHFRQNKGENIHYYYVRGLGKSNFDQLYAYLKQHVVHATENKMLLERHIPQECPQPKRPQDSDYFKDKMMLMQAEENGAVLDEEQLLFLGGEQVPNFDDDVDDPPEQDLALNVDHVFEGTNSIYQSFVKPYLSKHEVEIDRTLMELKTRAGDSATLYCSRVLVYGQTRAFEIPQMVMARAYQRPQAPPYPTQSSISPQSLHQPSPADRSQNEAGFTPTDDLIEKLHLTQETKLQFKTEELLFRMFVVDTMRIIKEDSFRGTMQEDLLELGMPKVTNFDDDVDDPPEQDLALNVDHIFEGTKSIYQSFVKPYLSNHEAEIDLLIYGQTRAFEIIQMVMEQAYQRPQAPPATAAPQESNQTAAARSSAVNTDNAARNRLKKTGFDQTQPLQFPIIHPPPQETSIKILRDQENQYKSGDIQELFRKLLNDLQNIHEELAEYTNSPGWNRPAFYNDDEDDDVDYTIAITPVLYTEEPDNSLSMRDKHLDTILVTKSDEVIKSSVENLVPIPSESEGIPDTMCDVHLVNNPTPLETKDHFEIVINSNDDYSSSDDDSLYYENIKYVEASPHDSELVSLEIVIPKDEEIKDDNLREKLLNVNLLIAKIEALKDNPTPSFEFLTKSSSTSPKSFLEETNTFDNSLPEFKNFCFDLEEINSGSTTTHSDISLPNYEVFSFYDDHIKEISSGSTTTHSDISLSEYDSLIFDLSNDQFPPTDRSDFTHEEFADELVHIISPSEYDCFYFKDLPDPGEWISSLNSGIRENLSSTTCVNLPVEDDHSPLLAYVI
nr:putative HVA22-like protein g [Tanacetum cinerariifolium]